MRLLSLTIPTLPIANPQISTRIIEGRITPTQDCYSENSAHPVFLRAQNIGEGSLDFSDAKRLLPSAFAKEKDAVLEEGDIVLTIDGVLLGKAAVHRTGGDPCCISNHMVRIHHGDVVTPDYLTHFLNSPVGQKQIKRGITGSAIPGIRTDAIGRILVPVPPNKKQADLVTAMDTARAEHWAKLAEADALLAGLDGYVLETLGLPANPSQRFVFAIRFFDVKNNRTDPDFHSLRSRAIRDTIESGRFSAYPVSQLCTSIVTGFAAGKHEQAFDFEAGVPHLRPLNLNIYGELSIAKTKFVPKEAVGKGDWCQRGDVLFNNTNSTEMVGKSAVFDLEQPCACSNHMTRLKPLNHMNAEFLAAVLNVLRSLGYLGLLSTNFNNQAGINTATLSVLRLPCPPKAIQDAISAEVCRRREEARRLRADAEAGWQAAKRWFEEQLLGPVQA